MNTPLKHVLFLTTLLVLAVSTAQAVNITVDAGSTCTLADAITAANTDTAKGGCPAGYEVDTITLQADVLLAAELPYITSTVIIEGGGHKIDANQGDFSVLTINTDSGNLTLNQATVTGTANPNDWSHGGIENHGTLTLNNSTVSGNTADFGGGIANFNGTVTLNNSTVSGNTARSGGGGINNYDTLTLNNSTISGNTADFGGGIIAAFEEATATLKSSLISGNSANSINEVYNMDSIAVTADSHNIFGHSGETNSEAFHDFTPGATDVTATSDGTNPTALAAILSPLADNGGSTLTPNDSSHLFSLRQPGGNGQKEG